MSKLRDKLRALHKPLPTEVPATTTAVDPRPDVADTPSDHRILAHEETQQPSRGEPRERPARPTRAERSRELPERLSAVERRAPLPDKTVLGTPNTVTSRGMAAWRQRRADTGSGAPTGPESADTSDAETTSPSVSRPGAQAPPSRATARQLPRSAGRPPVSRDAQAPPWYRPARHLSELTPGHIRIAAGRNIFVARRHYPASLELGGKALQKVRDLPAGALVALGLAPNAELCFLDIESSGLSGHNGSVPFMVGIATWDASGLLADVVTMHHPDDERGALLLVTSLLETVDAIVTFNGHVFDLPFLRQRFEVHGLDTSVLNLPHIDAYRVARRVLKGRQGRGAFKLTRLEQDLLGISRDGDIPGSEAPPRWFQTQRDGEVERLLPLLEHNQHDIMTLPALLHALLTWVDSSVDGHDAPVERRSTGEAIAQETTAESRHLVEERGDPVALFCRGLTAYQSGRYHEAAAILEAADLAGLSKKSRWSALKTLAQVQDALGQTAASEQTWRTLSELPSTDPLPLTRLVALARGRGDEDVADAFAERARQRAPWWRED